MFSILYDNCLAYLSLCLEGSIQNCELIVEEWQAIHLVFNQTPLPPSISEIIPTIARLGGYLGRKNDSPPWSKIYFVYNDELYKLRVVLFNIACH